MARIDFLPVCSNCGTVLWGRTIDILEGQLVVKREEEILWPAKNWNIDPLECPKCRHIFDSIVIPIKLPFETPEKHLHFY